MTRSLNLIDFLKGWGIARKLSLIIIPVSSRLFNVAVMQHRHRSNCHIFHCVAAQFSSFPRDITRSRDKKKKNAQRVALCLVSVTPTQRAAKSFHFFKSFCVPDWCVLCLHVTTKWQNHAQTHTLLVVTWSQHKSQHAKSHHSNVIWSN